MDIFAVVIVIVVVALVWIMYSPSNSDDWHLDPADDDIHRAQVRLIGREAPRFPAEASEVLQNFAHFALSDHAVKLLDGSIEEGLMTFVARSRGLGLRDYITIKAAIDVDGTKLSIIGRAKYPMFGSNSGRRIDRWLALMDELYGGI